MKHAFKHLKCSKCGREYEPRASIEICTVCHKSIDFPSILDIIYDYSSTQLKNELKFMNSQNCYSKGIWRFKDLLPNIPEECYLNLGEGHTPIIKAKRIGKHYGLEELYIKNETLNPTGSYKDRLAAVMVAKAKEAKAKVISLVSSGNMAAAISAYAAIAGIKTYVILPPATPDEKITQIKSYGGIPIKVKGSGSDRINLNQKAIKEFGWFNGNSPFNPYGTEGAKTLAYEEWEFFGTEKLPEKIMLPVGFGDNLVGHWKGFRDLKELGLISKIPKLVGIQPEGSPSFVDGFIQGKEEAIPGKQETIAGGISQRVTLNSYMGLRAIRSTGGTALTVSDEELLEAQRELAIYEGIFAEPTGVAAVAGAKKMIKKGQLQSKEKILTVVTGSGFKDFKTAENLVATQKAYEVIEPNLQSLKNILKII